MIETIKTVDDLLQFHKDCSDRGRELMNRKNHDYSGVVDVFRNFRAFEELGIVVRMGDKLSRLKSFEEKRSLKVADESIDDTAIDLMNYAILYLGYKRCAITKRQRYPLSTALREPWAYLCPSGCGCTWRDNKDNTMSLFGPNSKSCEVCEKLPLSQLVPLYMEV